MSRREKVTSFRIGEDPQATATLLHQDVWAIFREGRATRLRTSELVASLSAIDGRPWTGISSQELDRAGQRLADWLRPLHIRPHTLRFGIKTYKGYERGWFEKAADNPRIYGSGGGS
jgi:hypothetical protein